MLTFATLRVVTLKTYKPWPKDTFLHGALPGVIGILSCHKSTKVRSVIIKNSSKSVKQVPQSKFDAAKLKNKPTSVRNVVKKPMKKYGANKIVTTAPVESTIFKPIEIQPTKKEKDEANIGEELAGELNINKVIETMNTFKTNEKIKKLAADQGLNDHFFLAAVNSFHVYCRQSEHLSVELHIILSDIIAGSGHIDDLFPYFMQHAKQVFPHFNCMEDLKKISNLTDPINWYPMARGIQRHIIFHAGPTNSGKTYHALNRFTDSDVGIYCGPLRLLAMEVFSKTNELGTPCDLVTGETRRFANGESASCHLSCTVEMVNINAEFDVGVIDEIQMIADPQRGWAWTRALLGVVAKEVHVCGEATAIPLVEKYAAITGDTFEVKSYDRLTSLTYESESLGDLRNVKPGDCIVCFNKTDLMNIKKNLETLGHQPATIYGSLPPGSKIKQSAKFNDPADPCNVMVATDAIGMGLNLAIKRVIFHSLMKPIFKDGRLVMGPISTSQAQQIAGRAGRFRTQYENGLVTCFHTEDMPKLKTIVNQDKPPLQKAGLNPTSDQIEMFAYHLPKASLSNLMDIFLYCATIDQGSFFMCNLEEFKLMADLIEDLPLSLSVKYKFCSAPVNTKSSQARVTFIKFAKQYSLGIPLTYEWLYMVLNAPFNMPNNQKELERLEYAFDMLDLYMWLGQRFGDMFLDLDTVAALKKDVDIIIQTYLEKKERKQTFLECIFNTNNDNDGDAVTEEESDLIDDSYETNNDNDENTKGESDTSISDIDNNVTKKTISERSINEINFLKFKKQKPKKTNKLKDNLNKMILIKGKKIK